MEFASGIRSRLSTCAGNLRRQQSANFLGLVARLARRELRP
jgi:hypothetical protein